MSNVVPFVPKEETEPYITILTDAAESDAPPMVALIIPAGWSDVPEEVVMAWSSPKDALGFVMNIIEAAQELWPAEMKERIHIRRGKVIYDA